MRKIAIYGKGGIGKSTTTQNTVAGLADVDAITLSMAELARTDASITTSSAALAIAANDDLQPKALIVGHEMLPGYRSELQQLADNSGVAADVTFMDFTSEPQMLMQLCDCIALTSREETFGLVLPEAMRCGVAVIGSNRGGVPEIITHEQTGLLFESWDAASLYKQIRHLYTDAEFREQLAHNGREEADRRFNTEAHFAALEQHLQQAAAGHQGKNGSS